MSDVAARAPMMDAELVADCVNRLAKVSGQAQGISRMIEAGRYCVDVLDQINATQKALDKVAGIVMHNYLRRCVTDAIQAGDPLIYDEIMRVIDRRR